MSNKGTPEEVKETCDEVNQENSGLEKFKAEETIENILDAKDQKLFFKPMENKIGDICDDELIFKYIHKKFSTKNRESVQDANAFCIELEYNPLEATLKRTEQFKR